MNNLKSLMEDFSILGMEKAPLQSDTGLDFPPQEEMPEEEEYELDADGNPILDANGLPVKKVKTDGLEGSPSTCGCEHREGDLPAAPIDSTVPPEDEFDFKI